MKIPNTILVLLSIIVTISAVILNLSEFAYGHAKLINTVTTLCFIIFWMIFLFLVRKEGKLLMYAAVFWGLTLIVTVITILINCTTLELEWIIFLMIPLLGPLYGIEIISANIVVTLAIIAVVSTVFTGCGIWLIKSIRKANNALNNGSCRF